MIITIMDFIFVFSLLVTLSYLESCEFNAQVRSETDRETWAQFTFHNKSQSEVFKFSKYGEVKNFTITGTFCNLSPTVLKSWEELPKKDSYPVGLTSAHLEGMGGTAYYKIFPKDGPALVRSEGMFCSWGQCRLGK
uniref:Secreted protein n=1 Tax=Caenorhabditis tropicalis TaxID=1561998 RepID=A0A1I7V4N8_9PELO